MPKKPLVKSSLFLDRDDKEWFQQNYARVGVARVIRKLMSRHRRYAEARASLIVPAKEPDDDEFARSLDT